MIVHVENEILTLKTAENHKGNDTCDVHSAQKSHMMQSSKQIYAYCMRNGTKSNANRQLTMTASPISAMSALKCKKTCIYNEKCVENGCLLCHCAAGNEEDETERLYAKCNAR